MPGILWRLFFAVELSQEIQAGVRRIQQGLKERAPGVRWVRPEGIHLTLRFLGEVAPERIEDIWSRVARGVQTIDSFTFGVRGCGGFPIAKKPRVIWIGIQDPSGSLKAMQAKVETGVVEFGFPREERGYNPHLTLGRLHPGKGQGMIAQAIEATRAADLGEMEVREVCLFRSQLKPTGAEYTKLKVIPLRS
ncbi:MAG: 2'-5' RNA ligase [Deltaproteobacteria bacterium RBG_16_54_18]|nr:MAG: 2'-5' RNA ligase [Deltaproteobacteria bacterium RBG_16_54_18]